MRTLCVAYKEECGVRILQVKVNFACYYRMPKDWNPETHTRLRKYILKYSAGSGKMKPEYILVTL